MRTPALPMFGPVASAVAPSVTAYAARATAWQPDFGIALQGAYPAGVVPIANDYYNDTLAYYNQAAVAYPSFYLNNGLARTNPGYVDGLINVSNNGGNSV